MERIVEIFFDQFVKEICGEGERRIKLQAFSACLVAVLGVRKLFVLAFLVCFTCFLAALSFFGALFVGVEMWKSGHIAWLDPRLDLCLGVWVASTGLLIFAVREKKWAAAFGLQERIRELEREEARGGIGEAELVRLIERVLDERAKRREQQQKAQQPQPDQAA